MNLFEIIRRKISGEPHLGYNGGRITLTAAHRLPSSGNEERLVFRILGVVGAAAILRLQIRRDQRPQHLVQFCRTATNSCIIKL